MEATVDCKHGIVTGVDVFPANEKESLLVLRHLERQQKQLGLSMALNLKRMAKAIFPAIFMDKIWAENMISRPIFCLCQQVPYSTLSPGAKQAIPPTETAAE